MMGTMLPTMARGNTVDSGRPIQRPTGMAPAGLCGVGVGGLICHNGKDTAGVCKGKMKTNSPRSSTTGMAEINARTPVGGRNGRALLTALAIFWPVWRVGSV